MKQDTSKTVRYRAMKTTVLTILLIVGFILLTGTESEYGQSNIIGLCLFAFSGWRLGLFSNGTQTSEN